MFSWIWNNDCVLFISISTFYLLDNHSCLTSKCLFQLKCKPKCNMPKIAFSLDFHCACVYNAKLSSLYVKEKGKDSLFFIILLVFFNLFLVIITFYRSGFDTRDETNMKNHSLTKLSTLKLQRCLNVEITTSVQLSNTTIFQPCFNFDVWPLYQCWYNVVVPAGLASSLSIFILLWRLKWKLSLLTWMCKVGENILNKLRLRKYMFVSAVVNVISRKYFGFVKMTPNFPSSIVNVCPAQW